MNWHHSDLFAFVLLTTSVDLFIVSVILLLDACLDDKNNDDDGF